MKRMTTTARVVGGYVVPLIVTILMAEIQSLGFGTPSTWTLVLTAIVIATNDYRRPARPAYQFRLGFSLVKRLRTAGR